MQDIAIPKEPQTVKHRLRSVLINSESGEFAEMLPTNKSLVSFDKTSVGSNLSRTSIPIKNFEKALSNNGSPIGKRQKMLIKTTLQPIDQSPPSINSSNMLSLNKTKSQQLPKSEKQKVNDLKQLKEMIKKLKSEDNIEQTEEYQRLKRIYRSKLVELGIVKKKILGAK